MDLLNVLLHVLIKVFSFKQFKLSLLRSLCLVFSFKNYFMSYSQFQHP